MFNWIQLHINLLNLLSMTGKVQMSIVVCYVLPMSLRPMACEANDTFQMEYVETTHLLTPTTFTQPASNPTVLSTGHYPLVDPREEGITYACPPKGPDSFVLTYKIFETQPCRELAPPLRKILNPPLLPPPTFTHSLDPSPLLFTSCHKDYSWFPHGLEMGKHFPVRKFGTDWKSQGILPQILEKWGNCTQNTEKMREF